MDNNTCLFKVVGLVLPPSNKMWVLGLSFFHNYYTVFDLEKKRVGFVESLLANHNICGYEDLSDDIENSDDISNAEILTLLLILAIVIYVFIMVY